MKLVIGTDEAGYGPNLGPLVIAGTAWLVDDHQWNTGGSDTGPDLYELFRDFFARTSEANDERIRVGDSKEIYKSGGGLTALERLVLSLTFGQTCQLQTDESRPTWSQLLERLLLKEQVASSSSLDFPVPKYPPEPTASELPWYAGFDPDLPIDLDPAEPVPVVPETPAFSSGACRQLLRVIEPGQFNEGVRRLGNKATLLSHSTISIVFRLLESVITGAQGLSVDRVIVFCDKHGGRARYGGVLQEVFSECWVQVLEERPLCSRYQIKFRGTPVFFEFLAKGESQLPIAAASMMAKYVREVSMLAFNQFWLKQIPGLQPTAGYPVDAKRFRQEIGKRVKQLGIKEADWWRAR